MKRLLTLFACAVTLFTACTKDDGGTKVRTYSVSVRLVYPDDGTLTAAEGVEVRMTNSSSGTVVQAATDAQGVASFLLPEGIYERPPAIAAASKATPTRSTPCSRTSSSRPRRGARG